MDAERRKRKIALLVMAQMQYPTATRKRLAKKVGVTVPELNEIWEAAQDRLIREGIHPMGGWSGAR